MSGDMSEQEKREFLKANPEILKRATELYDTLKASIEAQKRYKSMTNAELANQLLEAWADLPIFSQYSDLLEEVMDRLRGEE